MMKDKDQKKDVLKYCVANRWLPALEVDVQTSRALREKSASITDLDVYACIPDEFNGYRSVVFDCKTKAKESPVNRALWLIGVLRRMNAYQGICILKKDDIELDHRLMAIQNSIMILSEEEFDLYARLTLKLHGLKPSSIEQYESWERYFAIPTKHPTLRNAFYFLKSGYWMIEDPAEACRITLHVLRTAQPELNPDKPEHLSVFFHFCSSFARSLAIVVSKVFKMYLQPQRQEDLAEAVLVMLYGGQEGYKFRNSIFKLVAEKRPDLEPTELSLPEWDRFLKLVRQCLDAPQEILHTPLILKEIGFAVLNGNPQSPYAEEMCKDFPQAATLAVWAASYLGKAAKLPPEFVKTSDEILLPMIPAK